jgi:hypothetical protein
MLLENLNDPNIQAILEAQGHASYASRVEEKERILKIITKHILIDAPRSLIEELKDGLQTLGILDSIIQYPEQFREMFTSENINFYKTANVSLSYVIIQWFYNAMV